MTEYLPEGGIINSAANKAALQNILSLQGAQQNGTILEAKAAVCTAGHDLLLDLGDIKGVIPRTEGAIGIESGETRDIAIISRVNKPVCFRVLGFEHDGSGRKRAICSRRAAQESCVSEYLSKLVPGDVIPAAVTHMESFGCFADIGCGISSLLPIDSISVSRIGHPGDRFRTGQNIFVVVSGRDESGRICLSHKELLGTWEENAAAFSPGETVGGIIRSVEDYGVFVELTPNLAGLAEPHEGVTEGSQASVYIKNIVPEKMKIKLVIIDVFNSPDVTSGVKYFFKESHMDKFIYSPENSIKVIETDFKSCPSYSLV